MTPRAPAPAARLRAMDAGDMPFVLARMVAEGWAATAARVQVHLDHDPTGCFVAELGRTPVGLVTTTHFRTSAWIGNLIVAPTARRRGVGTALIRHCLDHLERQGVATVRLEADPMGEGIYRREAFVDECVSRRFWLGQAHGQTHAEVTTLGEGELEAIAALDAPAFGDHRGDLLRLLFAAAVQRLTIGPQGARRGYLFVVPTQSGLQLGPCVAEDPAAGRALVETALAGAHGAVVLGVPEPNHAALACYASLGFVPNPSSLRMVRGPRDHGGALEHVWALASGACG